MPRPGPDHYLLKKRYYFDTIFGDMRQSDKLFERACQSQAQFSVWKAISVRFCLESQFKIWLFFLELGQEKVITQIGPTELMGTIEMICNNQLLQKKSGIYYKLLNQS